jgi:hypothetical protein
MSESIWDEIMRSPLEPDPDERRGLVATVAPMVLAIVVGLGLGFVLGGEGKAVSAATVAVASTTTSTSEPPPPDPVVPDGYVDAEGVGLRALATFNRDDSLYVVVNSAARSDQDPLETGEFHVAEWVLAGDGIERTAFRAIESDFAPGVRLVEFPGVTALPVSVPELRIRQATDMVARTGCDGCGAFSADATDGVVPLDGVAPPFSLGEPLLIPVGLGINLSIDELDLGDEWGYARWHVLDQNDARLRVTLTVVFEGTDDPATEDVDATMLVSSAFRGANQQNPVTPNPDPFTREGTLSLDRVGEILTADNQPAGMVLHWGVEWQHPVGDPITLPLENVTDLGSID